jgi:hypothetical protein
MKCRDPKTNIESGENFVNAWDGINFTMMSHVNPYLVHQMSVFMAMNLYEGAHKSENQW